MYASLSFWQMSTIGQCVYNNCVLEYHRLTFLNSCESFCKAWFDRSICYSRSYCCNRCPVAQIWPRNQTLKCRKSLASNLFLCCLTWSLTSWWRTSLKSNPAAPPDNCKNDSFVSGMEQGDARGHAVRSVCRRDWSSVGLEDWDRERGRAEWEDVRRTMGSLGLFPVKREMHLFSVCLLYWLLCARLHAKYREGGIGE